MYQIIKILNNNALLVQGTEKNTESILLGKGIGFGKKNGSLIKSRTDVKEYKLAGTTGRSVEIGTENGIEAVYLEAAARIIDEARLVFHDEISSDVLLPLADHIAFSAKREREHIFVSNPFIPDIKVLFGKEYAVALKSRDIIKELAGYEITDDEAGFIALHIHSGLSHEQVSDTLKNTQLVDDSMQLVEALADKQIDENSLTYSRLLSHLYYMIIRTKTGEKVNICLNEFMEKEYPKAIKIAEEVCKKMSERLALELDEMEKGFLAVHIERCLSD
ncbi:MAG: PRD domain-containing protein [Lachnospiraceae bacterium]|nr:PRD domain-containing protein [Lachnospiraceae bacterium]